MTVNSSHIYREDGYSYLRLELDVGTATLCWEQQKPTLTAAGLTYLGPGFEDVLPVIDFQIPGEPGNVQHLRGFTDDPGIAALFRTYLESRYHPPTP